VGLSEISWRLWAEWEIISVMAWASSQFGVNKEAFALRQRVRIRGFVRIDRSAI
jgi:hypothetical protein